MQEPICNCPPPEQVRAQMPCDADIAALAEFFRTMGADSRLKILLALDHSELCAGALSQTLNMTPSAVSNQLKALKAARLVTVRREGKMLYYSLADCHPREIIHLAMSHVKEDGE